uniref:28S ribosomal protein S7, mitochondrial-like n=1 Tax=Phallusia mammillata TaxID=59560 RepID=A0A6F9DKP2_9ASCI|nr:28S ribosomal protein S7, mitochondrial-like [Phallusia mammillata]
MLVRYTLNLLRICSRQHALTPCQCRVFAQPSKGYAIYPTDMVDPQPSPEYYKENLPEEGDELSIKKIKAASSSQTYSTLYNPTIDKFTNLIVKEGKKFAAERIMQTTLAHIKLVQLKQYHAATESEKAEIEVNPTTVFCEAFNNMKPVVNVRSIRHGANVYQVPYSLEEHQRFFVAGKWLLDHIRKGKPSTKAGLRIAREILAAYNNQGEVMRKKYELHKLADANRAYAHFAWKRK